MSKNQFFYDYLHIYFKSQVDFLCINVKHVYLEYYFSPFIDTRGNGVVTCLLKPRNNLQLALCRQLRYLIEKSLSVEIYTAGSDFHILFCDLSKVDKNTPKTLNFY